MDLDDFKLKYEDSSSFDWSHGLCLSCFNLVNISMASSPSSNRINSSLSRILVVDDNQLQRLILEKMVKRAGFPCDSAANATEALQMIRHTHYSLILMDCMMSDMDGWTAAAKIREEYGDRKIMIVAVTGLTRGTDLYFKCKSAGMDDVAQKPLSRDKLNSWLALL